jgi:predicted transcriptional regulator
MGTTNSHVLGEIVRAIYHVAGRRTTSGFAAKVIGSIIKTLEQKYGFLKYVKIIDVGEISEEEAVVVSEEIDEIDKKQVGRAIEAVLRIAYMDIIGKAGLFFIAEIKRRAGEELINELYTYGVDLATLQVEQHYLYRSRERRKKRAQRGATQDVSLLGYSWRNVGSWKYDNTKGTCTLYSKDGDVLDNLNLESIIQNYVKDLSDDLKDVPGELEEVPIDINDKELQLLQILRSRDMDSETAMVLLHVSKDEFGSIVRKLLENELLQYTSYNVIELTEIGINYLNDLEKKENSPEVSNDETIVEGNQQ